MTTTRTILTRGDVMAESMLGVLRKPTFGLFEGVGLALRCVVGCEDGHTFTLDCKDMEMLACLFGRSGVEQIQDLHGVIVRFAYDGATCQN